EGLARDLERAIRAVLESEEFKATLPAPTPPKPFLARTHAPYGRGRFVVADKPIGIVPGDSFEGPREIRVAPHGVCWFRLMPQFEQGRTWTLAEVAETLRSSVRVQPLSRDWPGHDFVRGPDGCGIFTTIRDERGLAWALAFAFATGELWGIDCYWLQSRPDI